MVKRSKTKTIVNHLPEELIHEILINLPVKPLLRFKTVSKQWRCLISNKSFTKAHLQKSSDSIDRHNLMYESIEQRRWRLRSCSLKYLLHGPKWEYEAVPTRNHGPIGNRFSSVEILGSCNGLVLLQVDVQDLLIVWNPSTRLFKYIPPSQSSNDADPNRLLYGFGYDDSTDDYKIVCILTSKTYPITEIHSLRSDSWKEMENSKTRYPVHTSGKLVNGKLHWLLANDDSTHSGRWEFVALDLAKEEYEIVDGPDHPLNYYSQQWDLLNLGGYLGVMCVYGRRDRDVWVMMKYGEAESWTRIWRQSEYPSPERNIVDARSVWFKNGDIAICFDKSIVVYNKKNKSLKPPTYMIDGCPVGFNCYVESLVSPFGNE